MIKRFQTPSWLFERGRPSVSRGNDRSPASRPSRQVACRDVAMVVSDRRADSNSCALCIEFFSGCGASWSGWSLATMGGGSVCARREHARPCIRRARAVRGLCPHP
eukprot:9501046-Pyramimonas_sp.AAC.1